jgi:hypothetical protein
LKTQKADQTAKIEALVEKGEVLVVTKAQLMVANGAAKS